MVGAYRLYNDLRVQKYLECKQHISSFYNKYKKRIVAFRIRIIVSVYKKSLPKFYVNYDFCTYNVIYENKF